MGWGWKPDVNKRRGGSSWVEGWRGVVKMICGCSGLREVGGFASFPEYDDFLKTLKSSDLFFSVEVEKNYSGVGGLEEFWFKCRECGDIWRIVEPDPPFGGMWCKV
ncbi:MULTISPECIES: hypothetical protein [Pseudomonas]|uniref:hypothetical protein n=1 Tax=Pseudomonas TaxID=286 RepID=UPI001E30B358|nr:hypothetical protein [Pseudomonas oryzagri]